MWEVVLVDGEWDVVEDQFMWIVVLLFGLIDQDSYSICLLIIG